MKTKKINKSVRPFALPAACVGDIQFDSSPPIAIKNDSLSTKGPKFKSKLKIGFRGDIGFGQEVIVTFGSVTVKVHELRISEVKRNIKEGQDALSRAIKRIITPGVKIEVARGVPMFHANPTQPGQIVRQLNGKSESGVFVNGKFKISR